MATRDVIIVSDDCCDVHDYKQHQTHAASLLI